MTCLPATAHGRRATPSTWPRSLRGASSRWSCEGQVGKSPPPRDRLVRGWSARSRRRRRLGPARTRDRCGCGTRPPSRRSAGPLCTPAIPCSWQRECSPPRPFASARTSSGCAARSPRGGDWWWSGRLPAEPRISRGTSVAALARALRADPTLVVVALSLTPGAPGAGWPLVVDGLLAERVHHLPAWAGLDDVAAAMSGSARLSRHPRPGRIWRRRSARRWRRGDRG